MESIKQKLSISFDCNSEQKEFIQKQAYIHHLVYNTCLKYTISTYFQAGVLDTQNWINFLQTTMSDNNPIWPNVFNLGKLSTIYGALNELHADILYYYNNMNLKYWPQEKSFGISNENLYYQMSYNNTFDSLHLNDINISIPDLGMVKLDNSMSSIINPRINTNKSYISDIQISYNINTDTCLLTLICEIILAVHTNPFQENEIGIYLGSNPYEIILSNGNKYNAPEFLLASIHQLKASYELENSLLGDQKETQQRKLHVRQKSLENKILKQRNLWFNQVANDIMKHYTTIAFENQPREPGNSIEFPGWIQFTSELYNVKKSYPYNFSLINVTKHPSHLTQCFNCGFENLQIIMENNEFTWICPHCFAKHDTKINAAKNILKEALKK